MIWIFPALAGLLIVYMAMRSSRFRRFAEPVLSALVALGFLTAFVVWFQDGGTGADDATAQSSGAAAGALTAQDLKLDGLTFERQRPETSYRVTGTVTNSGAVSLDYFRLKVTLEDCPGDVCKPYDQDTALILARVAPGRQQAFETFYTFQGPDGVEPTNPKWSYAITEVRGRGP